MQQNINERMAEKKHQLNVWRAQLKALMEDDQSVGKKAHNELCICKHNNEIIFSINGDHNNALFDPELPFNEDHFDEFEDTIVKVINQLKDIKLFGK